jgi:hypothetical protein
MYSLHPCSSHRRQIRKIESLQKQTTGVAEKAQENAVALTDRQTEMLVCVGGESKAKEKEKGRGILQAD